MTRYQFKFRTLSDPLEFETLEAGPFTHDAASAFAQMRTVDKAMITGKIWVCNYSPIVDASEGEPSRKRPWLGVALVFATNLLAMMLLWWGLNVLREYEDHVCRFRAETGVTLCTGEVYSTNLIPFGEIECGCRGAP